ncbi:MAG: molecular chaperone HtpG [Chloroflexi bacterium]|nr:molecular chaperone HtpG [Chloroflexota bacterium]
MTAPTAQTYEFRAEIQQLLHILIHALYTDREIFLRELISNAADALNRLRFEQLTNAEILDPEAELAIRITFDPEARKLVITDTGIGMNRDEIVENLGTIAHSGAMAFVKAMQERGAQLSTEIIGQFGVGFYSVFMVAEKVEVLSRSYRPNDQAVLWTSNGTTEYTVAPAERATRGTQITIYVKEDAADLLNEQTLKRIITTHSNYIPFPIYLGDKVVNAQTALWRRNPREIEAREYQEFFKQLTFDANPPTLTIHQVADAPVQFYALLFVPAKLDRGILVGEGQGKLRLYARKVLIQDHAKELLPEWMRFVEGVVDSEDLPLNVSREAVQSNRLMQRLKQTITSRVLSELESLAEKSPERYLSFWREFGRLIKEGVITDVANRERLLPLLRFRTLHHPDQLISLRQYVSEMVANQEHIYYLFGDDPQSILRSPHLDVFRARKVDVLLLTDTIDSFLVNAIGIFEGKKLHNGADADLKLPAGAEDETQLGEALPPEVQETLVARFKRVLGERVQDVRTTDLLRENAVRLVAPDQGFGADMERVYRLLDKDFKLPTRILEINPRHPLIRNLSAMPDEPLAEQVIEQLFEGALLVEGIHPRPADMVPRLLSIMEAATRRSIAAE